MHWAPDQQCNDEGRKGCLQLCAFQCERSHKLEKVQLEWVAPKRVGPWAPLSPPEVRHTLLRWLKATASTKGILFAALLGNLSFLIDARPCTQRLESLTPDNDLSALKEQEVGVNRVPQLRLRRMPQLRLRRALWEALYSPLKQV